ncbi:flagellar hook assembly protein FlgD [Pseudomonas sp. GD03842]|uniref:flagellar hook assembly protein FlgD n=1 Tax=unclassified Pseudomonas TaxID=196821 RepID=UPI000D3BD944|nr:MULTISPECIES: flagellar hook assembly protein FlgD [unclassified Pseudomonas]MDH0749133.1 flagellar hook assembly protein FlgD [Pseudomonas sp. GD03842]RAU39792.1 flagellar hook assembly protein FlgD [Pseudomonas sp. RIT 409]RAU46010.1 flagellar hook assembly protein FlgD [Pseudomonas sp. RIT 412]
MTVTNDTSASDYIKSLQKPTSDKTGDSTTGANSLGKDAFLQLLVTQMQNQNPLDPQDNSQFVAQLAQFSSLESIQNLNTSVDAIGGMYQSSQALQASSLVGRSVIVDGGSTHVDTAKEMTGQVVLPSTSTLTTVSVYDSTGSVVRTIDLGEQKAGKASFTWDGKDEAGNTLASGNYSFKAQGTLDGTKTGLTTYLPATVTSVTMGSAGSAMTLNLADGTNIALSKVQQIGI